MANLTVTPTVDVIKLLRQQLELTVLQTLRTEPLLSYPQVAAMSHVSRAYVCIIVKRYGIHRATGRKIGSKLSAKVVR